MEKAMTPLFITHLLALSCGIAPTSKRRQKQTKLITQMSSGPVGVKEAASVEQGAELNNTFWAEEYPRLSCSTSTARPVFVVQVKTHQLQTKYALFHKTKVQT